MHELQDSRLGEHYTGNAGVFSRGGTGVKVQEPAHCHALILTAH